MSLLDNGILIQHRAPLIWTNLQASEYAIVINVFEGARRITKFIAVIWIIGWIIKAMNEGMEGNPIAFASVAFGGLLFILAFTWAIGWIVRGFMGIPRGQDQKNESDDPTT